MVLRKLKFDVDLVTDTFKQKIENAVKKFISKISLNGGIGLFFYAGLSDSDLSFNIKVGFRKAGEPHSFALKYQTFGSEFHAEWITMFNYSYQFATF